MDITTEIARQHEEQRRAFAVLDELASDDVTRLGPIWDRLVRLLEVHASAEEKFFYPQLLRIGHGPRGDDGPEDETQDAIKDHNEIRDAVAEAGRHEVGSESWWNAVAAAREANSDHMAEEEREDLPDFRRQANLTTRHDIAVQFLAYQAQHPVEVPGGDKDPQSYVAHASA